jgi:hypothetical protein
MNATHVPRWETAIKGLRIGVAWLLKKPPEADAGLDLVSHNGGTGGYSSFLGFVEARKTAVVVLSNMGPSLVSMSVLDTAGFELLRLLDANEDRPSLSQAEGAEALRADRTNVGSAHGAVSAGTLRSRIARNGLPGSSMRGRSGQP